MATNATGHSYLDAATGETLDVWFPSDGVEPKRTCLAERAGLIRGEVVTVALGPADQPASSAAEAYLRLHLISRRGPSAPTRCNLDGVFGLLANVAWTSAGPVAPAKVDAPAQPPLPPSTTTTSTSPRSTSSPA